jgi:hypothetical protein
MSVIQQGVQNDIIGDRREMEDDAGRLPYHTPELREYGAVTDLTLAATGGPGSNPDSASRYEATDVPAS